MLRRKIVPSQQFNKNKKHGNYGKNHRRTAGSSGISKNGNEWKKQEYVLKQETIENPEAEIERMEKAKETATEQLEELYQKALKEAGEEQAMIFDVHKMMLDDADYLDSIRGLIRMKK